VLEKAFSVGLVACFSTDVAMSMQGEQYVMRNVVAGLGGRSITRRHSRHLSPTRCAATYRPSPSSTSITTRSNRERDRMAKTRRSGPSAENLLRDRGALSASYPRSES